MTAPKTQFTIADLLRLPGDGCRYELLGGELVGLPLNGFEHGEVLGELGTEIKLYLRSHDVGRAAMGDTGIILRRDPDRVRAPDLCFFSHERLPAGVRVPSYTDVIPDLVAEVVSPSDTAAAVQQKVEEWLRAGVRLVWVLYPATRTVYAYRSVTDVRVYTVEDMLDGGEVLPGFACAVAGLFG